MNPGAGDKYLLARQRWAQLRGIVKNFGQRAGSDSEITVPSARAGRFGPWNPAHRGKRFRFTDTHKAGRLPLRVGSRPARVFNRAQTGGCNEQR